MEGRCVLAPEAGKARLPTVDWHTGGTARRSEAEDSHFICAMWFASQLATSIHYLFEADHEGPW